MRISVTGISTSSPPARRRQRGGRPDAGFTLIEILIVVLIIGLISAGILLSVSLTGRDRDLERESDRLYSLINYAREQGELQTREYGILFQEDGYEFLVYDALLNTWRDPTEDDAFQARKLPDGLGVQLVVETRPVVLRRPADAHDKTPQVMIYSDGDLTSFAVTLQRDGGVRSVTVTEDDKGALVEQPMVVAAAR
ncbi:MAG TPA: type II secretion system minor pseudopilin GspH [Steroidobacteraceae bacterium]|nr:type II secretion system minor pseudopilin GspH [Steroidobacteraceae bacterium]